MNVVKKYVYYYGSQGKIASMLTEIGEIYYSHHAGKYSNDYAKNGLNFVVVLGLLAKKAAWRTECLKFFFNKIYKQG